MDIPARVQRRRRPPPPPRRLPRRSVSAPTRTPPPRAPRPAQATPPSADAASRTVPPSSRTATTAIASAKSPARRLNSAKPQRQDGSSRLSLISVSSSSGRSAVVKIVRKKLLGRNHPSPPGPSATISAPNANASAHHSAAGSACARLPPNVPRLRIGAWAIEAAMRGSRSPSGPSATGRSNARVPGAGADPQHARLDAHLVQARRAVHVDQDPGRASGNSSPAPGSGRPRAPWLRRRTGRAGR